MERVSERDEDRLGSVSGNEADMVLTRRNTVGCETGQGRKVRQTSYRRLERAPMVT